MNLKERLYWVPRTFLKVLSNQGVSNSVKFMKDYVFLKKEIRKRLEPIIELYKIDNPGIAYQKYLDVDLWVFESLRRVYMLGLNKEQKKLDILDLGTGAGYFPFICNYYGHNAEALDVPDNELYNLITKELGIKKYSQYIVANKNLDINNKYDYITAFMICFNNHKTPELWHIQEWDFFLKNIAAFNLKPSGRIFLSFNGESAGEPVSKELLNYFSGKKGHVTDTEVSLQQEFLYTESNTLVLKAS